MDKVRDSTTGGEKSAATESGWKMIASLAAFAEGTEHLHLCSTAAFPERVPGIIRNGVTLPNDAPEQGRRLFRR
jgi:hypothetical protein